MGIYSNIEMPKSCGVCRFVGSCGVHNDNEEWPDLESIVFNDVIGIDGVRDPNCPFIPVQLHGRLIDADALLASKNQHYEYHSDSFYVETRTIELAPTIIPADKDGKI